MRSSQGPATARLTRAVRSALREGRLLAGDRPLVLAVSGGADSLALLWAAAHALGPQRLVVAHFSHGMRPAAQRREAALVRQAARSLGVRLAHGEAACAPGSEAAAREARYAFLALTAHAEGACAVATGHTRDDQAETVLLRLVRGTGLRGVGAMRTLAPLPGAPDVPLLRPLLTVGRADTEDACAEAGWRYASDGSNRSLAYARNRVRRRVLPELERAHAGAASALARFARSAQADADALDALAAAAVAGAEERTAVSVRWPRERLTALSAPLLARVLEAAWRHLTGPSATLSAARLEAAGRLVANPKGGALDLGGGMRLNVEQDACSLAPAANPASLPQRVSLPVPGQVAWGRWRLAACLDGPSVGPDDADTVTLDADAVGPLLGVRSRERGERIEAAGYEGPVRLQDLLVNARVPRGERGQWPLVVGRSGVVWVPGVRAARWALAGPGTARLLTVRAWRPANPAR